MILYHGTDLDNLIPDFNFNNYNNDYGKGLYTTTDLNLGKEWAAGFRLNDNKNRFVYEYELDLNGLKVLNLDEYDILHWVAELINNRIDTSKRGNIFLKRKEKFLKNYKIDTSEYDVIVGYRADDSFFLYYKDFVNGDITKETLEKAMRLGNLGLQYVIKSEKAFNKLKLRRKHILDKKETDKFKNKFISRDKEARKLYSYNKENQDLNGITIFDL